MNEPQTPEQLEAQRLSLMTLEERIVYRQRQWKQRTDAARQQQLDEMREAEEQSRLAKLAKKQRQAANRANRAAENQRIRDLRNSNRK